MYACPLPGAKCAVVDAGRVPEPYHARVERFLIKAAARGNMLLASPSRPRSARAKMGALLSGLIATTVWASRMPLVYWAAPEIPQAI